MPGKHSPASPRSYYVSLARALGAALGAVGLMVAAVLVLLSRGGDTDQAGSPAVETPRASVSRSASPRPSPTTPRPSPTASVLPASEITIEVLNGTSRSGLAARTRGEIERAGYEVLGTGNASRLEKSTIFYRRGARAEALAFQKDFPDFTVVQQSSSTGGAVLRVVLGADYP